MDTSLEGIAVVGIALRLPGDANNTEGLWRLLASGESAWTSVPSDRYNEEAFYHPNADDPNGTSNHPGGHFISGDIQDFDHAFFKITKSQAAAIDPQQRILMELAYEALESGGIPLEKVAGSQTSVYTAMFPSDYDKHLFRDTLDLPTYYLTGVQGGILSNRLSHVFNLRGPSMTIDTACSGGLVALHQACQSLREGESETAIVAASNLILSPDHFVGLSNLHMLSSDGRCYPFDVRGKGYGRGEGVIALVLKRLDDAIRDRHPIRAVVRSTALGQDGYTPQGVTYPNGKAQADLARIAYARAGLRREDVNYVEAHGTGTKAGDAEELKALDDVFNSEADRTTPLYVGSIKGAIGHSESAAGLASLVKVVEMLDRELILPVAGFETPKAGLPLGEKMQVPNRLIEWPHQEGITRRASIASFGFGGANAHAIVERGPRTIPPRNTSNDVGSRLFVFSTNTQASLKAMIQSHANWIERNTSKAALADIAYTLNHRRSKLPYRFSIVSDSRESLIKALTEGVPLAASSPCLQDPDVILIFTGQGAQWAGMGRDLLAKTEAPSTVFRDSIQASGQMLRKLGADWDLATELSRDKSESRLNAAEIAQPTSIAVQLALVALIRSQGIKWLAVVGHSSGEIAAAYAAGRITHENAIKVAYHRGFMSNVAGTKGLGRGAMLSVGLGELAACKYVEGLTHGRAMVACINSPKSVTISGDEEAVDEVMRRISAANDGTFHRKLLVDTAYHSHHMKEVADDFRQRLGSFEVSSPEEAEAEALGDRQFPTSPLNDSANNTWNGMSNGLSNGHQHVNGNSGVYNTHFTDTSGVTFVSSVTGEMKTSGFDAEYFVTNLSSPVRFSDAVQTLIKTRRETSQQIVFIEVGPHPALAGPVRQIMQDSSMPKVVFEYLPTFQRGLDGVTSALQLAGKLFETGVELNWNAVSDLTTGADAAMVLHSMPSYSWDHSTKHWYESRVAKAHRLREEPYHDLVGLRIPEIADTDPRWRHFLSRKTFPWLSDHMVDGRAVFPEAGFLCMAVEGISQLARKRFPRRTVETFCLRDIQFERELIIPEPPDRVEVQLGFRKQTHTDLGFAFTITALSETGDWYEHCAGFVEGILAEDGGSSPDDIHEVPAGLPLGSGTLDQKCIYQDMSALGRTYGPTFKMLDSITISQDASRCVSNLVVPDVREVMPQKHQRPHVSHPSTLDIIFQSAVAQASRKREASSITLTRIGEMLIANTPNLQRPGSKLDVSADLTTTHFHTTVSDLHVLAEGKQVLQILEMELKSTERPNANSDEVQDMCYTLDWKTPLNYAQISTFAERPTLANLLSSTVLGVSKPYTIGLGASVGLTEEVLTAVRTQAQVTTHDYVHSTPGFFDDAVQTLQSMTVRCRTTRADTHPAKRGFDIDAYDIVMAGGLKWLNMASLLVNSSGIILLVLDGHEPEYDEWRASLLQTSIPLHEQLSFIDESKERFVALLKPAVRELPSRTHIFTHSNKDAPNWVNEIRDSLKTSSINVSVQPLSKQSVADLVTSNPNLASSDDTIIVVEDDFDMAILSDAQVFEAATAIMCLPASVVWISPNDKPAFHQIEGVARTAHGENDHLRMATIHAATNILQTRGSILGELVTRVLQQVSDTGSPHAEREYRIREDGTVVVPCLARHDELNRTISDNQRSSPNAELRPFQDPEQSLRLAAADSPLFVADPTPPPSRLKADHVHIQVNEFDLPTAGSKPVLCTYVGTVTNVGTSVRSMPLGSLVVAVSPKLGASRLCLPANQVGKLSEGVDERIASALLVDTMLATYALRDVARILSSEGTILVHGARTAAGRSIIAIARSMGVRVTATAADSSEATLLQKEVGIELKDVLVARRSVQRRLPKVVFSKGLDAIIHASRDSLPSEALAHVKAFGTIIALGDAAGQEQTMKLPPNASFHSLDLAATLAARPDLIGSLTARGISALRQVPLTGFEILTRDVSDINNAICEVNDDTASKVVLQATAESFVQVTVTAQADPWAEANATYLVAGGLGDIGQRMLQLMVRRGARHIATLSRRIVDEITIREVQAKLDAVQPGARIYTLQADVSSEKSVRAAAIALLETGAPPVRGIIMAATLMKDRPLERATWDDHRSVTQIKVDGTPNLYRAFGSPDLKFFLSLSSVASLVGAQAEASYNAGNTLQDSLAHERQGQPENTRFMTVNFGWIEDSALTAGDEVREAALRRAGFSLIRREQLSRFFDFVLQSVADPSPDFSQAVIGFDAASLSGATAHNGNIKSAIFNQVREARRSLTEKQPDTGVRDEQTFEKVLAKRDSEATTAYIAQAIKNQLARLISVDVESIDVSQVSILSLGLDSLVAVELRNWILRQFDAPLQSTDILTDHTVQGLAEKILGRSKTAVK